MSLRILLNTSITVTPVDDPAMIDGDSTGVVTEGASLVAHGQLTITDPDSGESSFQAATIGGQYGTLDINTAGEWTYTLDSDFAITGEIEGTDPVTHRIYEISSVDGTIHTNSLILMKMGSTHPISMMFLFLLMLIRPRIASQRQLRMVT